ncbi:hypothetical protein AB1Y20_021471 [Prymnesium parvum]|uniref:Uncharacterized protein n=1 Tax=Prymnesium parvum TaxID=97485 RepID=A0AB34JIC6_PRYPA
MAWGQSSGASDLLAKAQGASSLCVLPFRSFGSEQCVALCDALRANRTLTELQASGHNIGQPGAEALGQLLGHPGCALRRLAIGHAGFGAEGVAALLRGLEDAACPLLALDLELKGLGATAAAVLDALLRRCSCLQQLKLSRNPLGRALPAAGLPATLVELELRDAAVSAEVIDALLDAAAALPALRLVDLSENALADEGCARVARLLALTAISRLKMRGCAVGGAGGEALVAAASAREARGAPLEKLDLSLNPQLCSCEGIGGFAACGVEELDLADCALPASAATALAAALTARGDAARLRTLVLRSNGIDSRGCVALLACASLHHVSLFNNPLGDDGEGVHAQEMVSAVSGSSVRTLDIGGCRLDEALVLSLLRTLAGGGAPRLQLLELMGNTCAEQSMQEARAALKEVRPTLDVAWKQRQNANAN